MLIVTVPQIQGMRIVETLGLVQGNTVRSSAIGKDILAIIKLIVGGEVTEYTNLLIESRLQAIERMSFHAERMGGNAIVGARFETAIGKNGEIQILAYGTAVKVK